MATRRRGPRSPASRLLDAERLVAHRELQLLRSLAAGLPRRYLDEREAKLAEAYERLGRAHRAVDLRREMESRGRSAAEPTREVS